MKSVCSLQKLFVISLPILLVSCVSVNGIHESPTIYGYGFNAMPGWQVGEGRSSAHLLVGYSHIKFDGGGGHNRIWEFGAQIRHSFTKFPNDGIWIGGEVSYLSITAVIDNNPGSNPHAGGFTIGPIAGYRFQIGRIPVGIYLAPSYLSRGKFEVDGTKYGSSGSGYYAKLGLDFNLITLLHKKAR